MFSFFWCMSLAATLFLPRTAYPATCDQWIAKAVSVEGNVEVQRAGTTLWQTVKLDDTFCPGDTIRVDEKSRAGLSLENQPLLRLDQNTTITLGGVKAKRGAVVELAQGALHFFSRIARNLEVVTGFVNAGVEGTEGLIRVEKDRTLITIYDGQVLASNAAGSLTLTSGQSAVAEAGKAPVARTVVRPRDAVHWALYYPPVMLFAPGAVPKEDPGDPRYRAYRAAQLLAVGRVDEAGVDIQQALRLDPAYSDAHALQAVIFVVQNERDKALAAAQKAVDTGPRSATARIAMSYAQQAAFDLEGARATVEEAVELDPENALAWARLAELQSSFGRLGQALDAAKKAVDLDPNLSRTQMVLGFAYLTQVKTTDSRAAFESAIALDQADPLSRLGLGLAKIRDGDLDAGGRQIEIAASLDPNNSLIRSYLGKTYFEQKQTGLDEREYAIAKELDPNDPTPWFYDAIAKQTTNRPVEALHNFEKAKELNDNRAVYRSRLLLDADLAARSAATARVFSDLGFQQRALVEGWSSVNTDPTNFSAHRFLADSYAALPRHEIARVSELLQSQLLQPLNITPIQPRLAESNLFLISAQGPASLSFTEFNPLFNRNRLALQGSGLLAENDTEAGEGIVSGIYKKLSFSGGYSYFDTDGWRDNADQNDKITNVFAQYEATPQTSVQAEYRFRDLENGDVQLRFFRDDFLPDLEEEEKEHTARLGFHHRFAPGSYLVGNFQYQNFDGDRDDEIEQEPLPQPPPPFPPLPPPPPLGTRLDTDTDAYSGELQHLLRTDRFNLVSGIGYFDIDSKEILKNDVLEQTVFKFNFDRDVEHLNAYLYANIDLPLNLTLTVGGSYDDFDADGDDTPDEDQFNPKLGLIWNPLSGTTLRAAAFRVFKRTLITDQTLEPTQVAGFNQFFDDDNAADIWSVGGALDQKFSASLFGGAEYYYRNLSSPYNVTNDDNSFDLRDAKWEENIFRAYLFWTPHEWVSLTAEYLLEDFDRTTDNAAGARELKTRSAPLGVNFFHPTGFSASVKGTYIDQDGDFERQGTGGTFEDADDDFFLVDAALGYRLPKRYGRLTAGVRNLFDTEGFKYFDTDEDNPRIQPDRTFFIQLTLAFP
jgi:tetratricopeptide (TPR) repeat protein